MCGREAFDHRLVIVILRLALCLRPWEKKVLSISKIFLDFPVFTLVWVMLVKVVPVLDFLISLDGKSKLASNFLKNLFL